MQFGIRFLAERETNRFPTRRLVIGLLTIVASAAQANVIGFESVPSGTVYGGWWHGYAPGDVVLEHDGITMAVIEFDDGSESHFGTATVGTPPPGSLFGPDQALHLENIGVRFDFGGLEGEPYSISFDYLDLGGNEELSVYAWDPLDPPPVRALSALDGWYIDRGVNVHVTAIPVRRGVKGTVTLEGAVSSKSFVTLGEVFSATFRIGGQSLWIDNIRRLDVDEGCCDHAVGHESLAVGTTWGTSSGDAAGTEAFAEDDVSVSVDVLETDAGPVFGDMTIDASRDGLGEGQTLHLDDATAVYDFTGSRRTPAAITFSFASEASVDFLQVDDGDPFMGDLAEIPSEIAPGVQLFLRSELVAGTRFGRVALVGPVERLRVGGTSFWVDHVRILGRDDAAPPWSAVIDHGEELAFAQWGFLTDGFDAELYEFMVNDFVVRTDRFEQYDGEHLMERGWLRDDLDVECLADGPKVRLLRAGIRYDIASRFRDVAMVRLSFQDVVGFANLSVNGSERRVRFIENMPEEIAPGVRAFVRTWPAESGDCGELLLVGDVHEVAIAGNHLYLDDVSVLACAAEEPDMASAMAIDFDATTIVALEPGDVVPLDSSIDLTALAYDFGSDEPTFGSLATADAPDDVAEVSGQVLEATRAGAGFDFRNVGQEVNRVLFDYVDEGGIEFLRVNGAAAHVGELHEAEFRIAPEVRCTVFARPRAEGQWVGTVLLEGRIENFEVGGEHLLLDDLVASNVVATSVPANATRIRLEEPTPNPFNPHTELRFFLGRRADVQMSIFDVRGRRVAELVDDSMTAGTHRVVWDGRDDDDRPAASGVYFVRLAALDEVHVRKMTLVK